MPHITGPDIGGGTKIGWNGLFLAAALAFLAGIVFATREDYREYLPLFLTGTWNTVVITASSLVVATVFASMTAVGTASPWQPIRWASYTYIELFRGTSLIVQLFWLYFSLPALGIHLPAVAVAIMGLGLNSGAYGAEFIRSACSAIPRQQFEAARVLGLDHASTLIFVIVPQVIVRLIPPWSTLSIQTLKGSALISLITIQDLTFFARMTNDRTMDSFRIYFIVMIIYFSIAMVISLSLALVENKFDKGGMQRKIR